MLSKTNQKLPITNNHSGAPNISFSRRESLKEISKKSYFCLKSSIGSKGVSSMSLQKKQGGVSK